MEKCFCSSIARKPFNPEVVQLVVQLSARPTLEWFLTVLDFISQDSVRHGVLTRCRKLQLLLAFRDPFSKHRERAFVDTRILFRLFLCEVKGVIVSSCEADVKYERLCLPWWRRGRGMVDV